MRYSSPEIAATVEGLPSGVLLIQAPAAGVFFRGDSFRIDRGSKAPLASGATIQTNMSDAISRVLSLGDHLSNTAVTDGL